MANAQPSAAGTGRGVAVVTGGSRGIGAACARLLARAGWTICLTYRAEQEAATAVARDCDTAARQFRAEHGITGEPAPAVAVGADLADPASIPGVFAAAARLGSPGLYVDYAASKGAVDTFNPGPGP
nr:SDR family NAD(P)-dependent oxidoreductase [Parafrankia elaeagni]